MSLSDPNNPLARLQGASTDQTSNPFDLKIRRPVLKGLWPSNRKEKKEKKNEKKTSTTSKTLKPIANQQVMATSIIDEQNFPSSNLDETNEFHRMMGSIDGINQIPNLTKSKCVSDEFLFFNCHHNRGFVFFSANTGALHSIESVTSSKFDLSSRLSKYNSVFDIGNAKIDQFE